MPERLGIRLQSGARRFEPGCGLHSRSGHDGGRSGFSPTSSNGQDAGFLSQRWGFESLSRGPVRLAPAAVFRCAARRFGRTARVRADNAAVKPLPEPAIAITSPRSGQAERALQGFFGEMVRRHSGRPATEDEIAALMRDDPSDDLTPPDGLLLLAEQDGDVLGCAGLRLLPDHLAEVTRVFVFPAARGQGLGVRLMGCIEEHARQRDVRTLRLDTSRLLTEARRLYARQGYQEVAPFSQPGPYTHHWFAKTLS